MTSPPPKKPDPFLVLARAASESRRRRPFAVTLLWLALLVALVGLAGWLIWPAPDPPPLLLATYDHVACPDQEIALRAQFTPATETSADPKDVGLEVLFDEHETGLKEKAKTGADGNARLTWHVPGPAPRVREVAVRWPGDRQRRAATATGRIFVWPADSKLLVVDVDHALLTDPHVRPRPGDAAALKRLPGAFEALAELSKSYRLVYLSADADSPTACNQLSAWLKQFDGKGHQLPDGPLLTRGSYPEASDAEAFQKAALADLKQRFPAGKVSGVVRGAEQERQFREAGLARTVRVGTVADGDGVVAWSEVGKRLE